MTKTDKFTSAHRSRYSISAISGLLAATALTLGITGGTASSADLSADDGRVVDFSIVDEGTPAGWQFDITPYAWLVGVSGAIGSGEHTLDVSASLYDLVENSDYLIPLMGYAEARNGRFSVFLDGIYTKMKFTNSNATERNPVGDAKLKLKRSGKLIQTLAMGEVGAAFEVARSQGPMGSTASLDLLAGARYWYVESDVTVRFKRTLDLKRLGLKKQGKFAVSKSPDVDWVDPVIGMRVRQDFGEHGVLQFLGDIGGFGAGSELTWQLFGGYSHDFYMGNTTIGTMIGYRALSFDYKSNSANLAMVLHGPIAGLNFKW